MSLASRQKAGVLSLLLLLLSWACVTLAQNPQVAQKPVGKVVTQQEFAELVARVAALEEQAARSTSTASTTLFDIASGNAPDSTVGSGSAVLERKAGGGSAAMTSQVPPGRAAWRKLRKGMQMDAVRSILGEPDRVESIVYTWWYYGSGRVLFDGELVNSWSEP